MPQAPHKEIVTTRAQSTTEAIRGMIVRGELQPGVHLQAQMLANRLGVSRTPVTDALAVLHNEGLLDYAPNRGYSVRQFDLKRLMDAFDVRLTLEGLACRIVAEEGLPSEILRKIEINIAATDRVVSERTWSEREQDLWQSCNLEFHDLIIGAADNDYLTAGVASSRMLPLVLDGELRPIPQSRSHRLLGQEHCRLAFRDHVRIVEAILGRQSARAENMMKEHIFTNREAVRRKLTSFLNPVTPAESAAKPIAAA